MCLIAFSGLILKFKLEAVRRSIFLCFSRPSFFSLFLFFSKFFLVALFRAEFADNANNKSYLSNFYFLGRSYSYITRV